MRAAPGSFFGPLDTDHLEIELRCLTHLLMVEWAPWLPPDCPWVDSLFDSRSDFDRFVFYLSDRAVWPRATSNSWFAIGVRK